MNAERRLIADKQYKAVPFSEIRPGAISGAQFMTEIWPAELIELPPPTVSNHLPSQFSWWGRAFYSMPEVISRSQALNLFLSNPGVVVGHDGGLELSDGRYHEPNIRYLKHHLPTSLFRRVDGQLWVRDEPEQTAPSGSYFLGFNAAWGNYAHLLTDTLPLLYYYRKNLYKQCKLIVPPMGVRSVYKRLLELMDIDDEWLFVMPNERVKFDHLLFTTQISLWSPSGLLDTAVDAVIDNIHTTTGQTTLPEGGARLYLSRRDADVRRLLNDDALIAELSSLDFKIIECSNYSFDDQVRVLQGAEVVVALHGAALINTLFCRPGAAVLELFPEYCVQPHFRSIAIRRKLRYGFMVGTSFEREDARAYENSWSSDFVLDERQVVSAVHSMLSTPASSSVSVAIGTAPRPSASAPADTSSVEAIPAVSANLAPELDDIFRQEVLAKLQPDAILLPFHDADGWRHWASMRPWLAARFFVDSFASRAVTHGLSGPWFEKCAPAEVKVRNSGSDVSIEAAGIPQGGRALLDLLAIAQVAKAPATVRVYAPEALSPFALQLRGRYPRFIGSEYRPAADAAAELFPITHQNLRDLKYPQAAFDAVLVRDGFDEPSAVPEVLRELARVLRPGGLMLATVRLQGDGNTPEQKPETSSLADTSLTWDALDIARQNGFARAELLYYSSRTGGIVGATSAGVWVLLGVR